MYSVSMHTLQLVYVSIILRKWLEFTIFLELGLGSNRCEIYEHVIWLMTLIPLEQIKRNHIPPS